MGEKKPLAMHKKRVANVGTNLAITVLLSALR
jgi:hypothetical protein